MKRFQPIALAAVLAIAAVDSQIASAQPRVPSGPVGPPVVSPYLNLLNGGGNPALNYFGIVVPQMQMQQQLTQLQQQQQLQTGRAGENAQDPLNLLPSTGTVPVFDNTFGYFNRLNGAGGGVSVGGGSFNRMGGAFGATPAGGAGGAGAAGFQRGVTSGGIQPSFAAPRTTAPNGMR